MHELLGIIDATSKGQLDKLTIHRMPGALPFAGKYRLIDFVLSNLKHTGISNVAIFPHGNYRSLQDHIQSGKRWDLDRRRDGLFILPPKNISTTHLEMVTFQRLYEHIEYFRRSQQSHVIVTPANIVWNIDFNEALTHHLKTGADITEIIGSGERLKTFMISRKQLIDYLFAHDTMPYKTIGDLVDQAPTVTVSTYEHPGYTAHIKTVSAYYRANLDMLNQAISEQIFTLERPIISKEKTAPPTLYKATAQVEESIISSGAVIEGTVIKSVIGRDVTVAKGANIEDSVIMNNTSIGLNSHLKYVVLDKGTIVKEATFLEGTKEYPYLTQKEQTLSKVKPMHILQVASEAAPFVKTGGLADVVGGLSRHLANEGAQVSTVLPFYKTIEDRYKDMFKLAFTKTVNYQNEPYDISVYHYLYRQVHFYFIAQQDFFARETIYNHDDDCDRFAFFAQAVYTILDELGPVDVVHAHDWHVGLLPRLLTQKIKTLLTLHNIDYQGKCTMEICQKLGINKSGSPLKPFNFLQDGITYADKLSTVSQTYRDELMHPYYGKNLTEDITQRERDFYGILNGISSVHNPATDRLITENYDTETLNKKLNNKRFLIKEMQLDIDEQAFLVGSISRIVEQKGFDIMIPALDDFLSTHKDAAFVLLGQGDEDIIKKLEHLARKHKGRVKLNIGYDATIPNYIYAGCDAFLMPSRVEPCGLGQMIAMRYGTLPIVRMTGGLADSVDDYDSRAKIGSGFVFHDFNPEHLATTLQRGYHLYHTHPDIWQDLMHQAMKKDFSLKKQALKTMELYRLMIEN